MNNDTFNKTSPNMTDDKADKKNWKDRVGGAVEKVGHKISDAGATKIGQKIHDLGDKIEETHDNVTHPHDV
jgi:hypothetical protein